MASDIWKISVNGAPAVTLRSLGIRNAHVIKRSLAADEFRFTVPVADITVAPAFTYGDTIALSKSGLMWWIGFVEIVSADAQQPSEALGVTCVNHYRNLERIIYQQKFAYRTGATFAGLAAMYSTRVTLGQDAWGRKIQTYSQISNIMTYALVQGSGVQVQSTLSSYATPPLGEARDISCAAAILRMVEYTPDAMSRFHYASNIPIMGIERRGQFPIVSLDLADKNLVVAINGLTARYDLRPRGVLFTFIKGVRNEATGELVPVPETQSAGNVSGPGVVASTITLALQGTDQAEIVPAGLATEYFNSLNYVPWEGQITLMEQECSGQLGPAMLLNLTNGYAPWATMYGTVTEVSEDLDHGITTVQLGLPGYLGAADFLDMMTRWRNRKDGGGWSGTMHNGKDGIPPDDGGDGEAPDGEGGGSNPGAGGATSGMAAGQTFPMEVCEDGVTKTRIVSGG